MRPGETGFVGARGRGGPRFLREDGLAGNRQPYSGLTRVPMVRSVVWLGDLSCWSDGEGRLWFGH